MEFDLVWKKRIVVRMREFLLNHRFDLSGKLFDRFAGRRGRRRRERRGSRTDIRINIFAF